MWGVELTVMLLMIFINSIFAAYEIALTSISLARLRQLVEENRAGATVALQMKQNMEASLAVVQLGITLVGAIAAAVGGAGAEENIAPVLRQQTGMSEPASEVLAILFVVAPLTVFTIIFGELIPKVFALRNAEWVCLSLSTWMKWFSISVWPAVWMFETVVSGVMSWGERRMNANTDSRSEKSEMLELRATAAMARASRLIGLREERIILQAAQMQSRPVREIMLPIEHMSTLDASASLADNLIAAHLDMHTRFPVVRTKSDPQSVLGYVNVKDIIAVMRLSPRDASLEAIVRPLPTFSENDLIAGCLERLLREHTHIALVRSASGTIVGLVSLEDIVEELLGEIQDEYDRLPNHVIASGKSWVAGGGVMLDRLRTLTQIDLVDPSAPQIQTLTDWVEHHLQKAITGGEIAETSQVRVVVRKARRHRVQEAFLSHWGKAQTPA